MCARKTLQMVQVTEIKRKISLQIPVCIGVEMVRNGAGKANGGLK
jgi:hypothetical protein